MRRLLHVGLHTFQFHRLQDAGLPLRFLFEPVQQFSLLNDDPVQLFDLVLEVRKVRCQLVYALGVFVRHFCSLPLQPPQVERGTQSPLDDCQNKDNVDAV